MSSALTHCRFGIVAACGVVLVAGFSESSGGVARGETQSVDYNRDVRPILAENCFRCHGPDANERQGGLRLDSAEDATAPTDSGVKAIVPGQPEASEVIRRIFAGSDEVMPPPDSGKSLSPQQKTILKTWIVEGGAYDRHWAFNAPRRPPVPKLSTGPVPRNEIDSFVLHKLQEAGLSPSPEADRRTLIRRVSLDLTGLPPTPAEVEQFMADDSPTAYEELVERLLNSPRFGERMALDWLDLARYADTDGYEKDSHREMWPYRDWVITAFNDNMPFDRFTIEQLAGDLLPDANVSQQIASAFNRNNPTTSEGGADPAEYAVKYPIDRLTTTSTVWLGLTMQCAECHDHKFDPLSARDFYSLMAFFDQVPEDPLYEGADSPPSIAVFSPEQQARITELDQRRNQLASELNQVEVRGQALAANTASALPGPETPGPPTGAASQSADASGATQAAALREQLAACQRESDEIRAAAPKVRIMADVPERRPTHIRVRGDFRQLGEQVFPAIPATLGALPSDAPANRLALARWLVGPDNPLTARVVVNRLWAMCFGVGIVTTVDDFGVQGQWPSHPELLDWLAVEFRESGWDVKHMLRLIVTSGTYRQESKWADSATFSDPENRYLARGPRRRLSAEMLRDNALFVGGLLREQVGGPSVFPYHPPGLWEEMAWADARHKTWPQSHGEGLYRRGLYTFWKRSLVHPLFAVFDAPTRTTCAAARPLTNSPLQSLATLNEPSFIEAARGLAAESANAPGGDAAARIRHMYLAALSRPPKQSESDALDTLYHQALTRFRADGAAADAFLAVGETPRAGDLDAAEHAAWTVVAQTVMSLDEAMTKP